MQVYRHCQRGYWRASKRWCKQLPQDAVSKALIRFANNEAGLSPAAVYGGPNGAIAQLKCLESWFQVSNVLPSMFMPPVALHQSEQLHALDAIVPEKSVSQYCVRISQVLISNCSNHKATAKDIYLPQSCLNFGSLYPSSLLLWRLFCRLNSLLCCRCRCSGSSTSTAAACC